MKQLFLLLMMGWICQSASAQNPAGTSLPKGKGKISGTVADSTNREPVPFATIALTDPNTNKPIDGTIADDNGKFTIEKVAEGNYLIVISFIGYQTKTIRNVSISDKKDAVNLGNIRISPSVQQLQEVTVEGQKAIFEEKVDRTVYNAENDATNRGGDAADVLRKVPSLSVDLDGNVSLRGSQNLRILINNRPSTITAGSVADALKQIPSDMIKSVEVITSPSAKYDAEGSAGIINIITKKNTLEGFSLNVDGSAGIRGSNLGLNGSFRKGKMGFSLGGFGRIGYNVTGSFENRQLTQAQDGTQLLTTQNADTRNNNAFGRYQFGWDYDINKYNFISASVQYGFRNGNVYQDQLRTEAFRNDALTSRRLEDFQTSDLSGTVDVNLNYTRTFEKPQREFSILTQYSRNNRTNDFVIDSLNTDNFSVLSRTKNLNESFNQEITLQADYQTPIGKNQLLELGAKDIIRQVSSDYTYLSAVGSDGPFAPIQNRSLSNVFDYNQNVTAGYTSYTLTTKSNYSFKAGVRYEYTTIQANFQDEQEVEIPSYGTLVPSVNVSRRLKNGNTLKAAYNRRIQRPSLQFLNPNIQANSPLNITIGNPDLRPEFTNNYELAYSTSIKKASVSLTAFMRNTDGAIQRVRDVVGQDTIRTTFRNIGSEDAYGFSVSVNVNLSNKFSLNGSTDTYYAVLENNVSDPLYNASNEGWVSNYRIFGNYTLTKGWGLQAFAFFRAKQVQLQGFQGGFGIYSLSLKKDFNNKRGSIGLGAENFFTPAFRINNEVSSPIIEQSSTNVLHNMNFKINFSYRIGKLTANANTGSRRRKSINNDDVKEGGSSTDQGGGGQPQTPAAAPQKPTPKQGSGNAPK